MRDRPGCDLCGVGLLAGSPPRCSRCAAPPVVLGGQGRSGLDLSEEAWEVVGALTVLAWCAGIIALAVVVLR